MENELESGLLSVCVCVGVCSIPRLNIVIIENRHGFVVENELDTTRSGHKFFSMSKALSLDDDG